MSLINKILNRAEILGVDDLSFEDVPVPQWGGSVRVREMTGAERDEFHAAINAEGGRVPGKISAAVLVATCVDGDGNRMFTMEDMDIIRAKGAASLDVLSAVAVRINKLGAAAVDDAEKNSESDQSGDSGSDLPKS